jgi:SAM-dependent methyltransferase
MTNQSAWENFDSGCFDVMRGDNRANHPSRSFIYNIIEKSFRKRPFQWLDVGFVGMVDYEHLVHKLNFVFTGVDISSSVIKDSEKYLCKDVDRLVLWNIEDPVEKANSDLKSEFDLVTIRHVLNHCNYYENPLDNIHSLLKDEGLCVVTLHLCLIEEDDRLNRGEFWDVPGEVISNYYNRQRFLDYFSNHFKLEHWVRFDDGTKPYDIVIGRKSKFSSFNDNGKSTGAIYRRDVVRFGHNYSRANKTLSKIRTYASCGILGLELKAWLKRLRRSLGARAIRGRA